MGYKQNIGSNVLNQIIKIAFGFLVSILIARALGPEKQGYVSYILLIIGIIASYAPFGINNATVYFQKKQGMDEQNLFQTNTTYLLINFALIGALFVVLRGFNLFLNDYSFLYIAGALLFIFFSYITANHNLFFLGDEKIVKSNNYALIAFFIKSFFITVLYFCSMLNAKQYFLICVLSVMINAVLLQKKIRFRYRLKMDIPLLKEEFRYGLIVYFSSLFIYLNYRADQIFIKYLKGNSDLGIYAIAVTLAELLFVIPTGISSALTARLVNTNNEQYTRKTIAQTVKFTFYTSIVLSICGALGSFLIPYVYGKAYSPAISATLILLAGIIFASIGRVSFPYFFAGGKAKLHLYITFATFVINLILNLILIPKTGINGAATASSISYLLYGSYYIFIFIRKENFCFRDFFYIGKEDRLLLYSFAKQTFKRGNQ